MITPHGFRFLASDGSSSREQDAHCVYQRPGPRGSPLFIRVEFWNAPLDPYPPQLELKIGEGEPNEHRFSALPLWNYAGLDSPSDGSRYQILPETGIEGAVAKLAGELRDHHYGFLEGKIDLFLTKRFIALNSYEPMVQTWSPTPKGYQSAPSTDPQSLQWIESEKRLRDKYLR